MNQPVKSVQTKWWKLDVPHDWRVAEMRGGKILYPVLNEDSKLEIVCVRREIGDITVNDFIEYFQNADVNTQCKRLRGENILYLKVANYGGDKQRTRWGIAKGKYLVMATYIGYSGNVGEVHSLDAIDKCLREIKFLAV